MQESNTEEGFLMVSAMYRWPPPSATPFLPFRWLANTSLTGTRAYRLPTVLSLANGNGVRLLERRHGSLQTFFAVLANRILVPDSDFHVRRIKQYRWPGFIATKMYADAEGMLVFRHNRCATKTQVQIDAAILKNLVLERLYSTFDKNLLDDVFKFVFG
jgi:hypothetical protein